jgi:hypothetical protein
MAAPSALVITLLNGGGKVTVTIASELQNLDSSQTVETQTGFSRVDIACAAADFGLPTGRFFIQRR